MENNEVSTDSSPTLPEGNYLIEIRNVDNGTVKKVLVVGSEVNIVKLVDKGLTLDLS